MHIDDGILNDDFFEMPDTPRTREWSRESPIELKLLPISNFFEMYKMVEIGIEKFDKQQGIARRIVPLLKKAESELWKLKILES